MRFRASPVLAWLAWAAALVPLAAFGQTQKTSRPKLVVVLVVDQMRADYVDNFRHQWTGGFKRLLERGAWFRQAAYPYFNTVTCPGHATIATGTFPATHGIALNFWWDRQSGRYVNCTEDPRAQAISYGSAAQGGYSAAHLLVPTFAEQLRMRLGAASRAVTFSIKPRSAIMLAGHRADAATWFDEKTGVWATSSAFANAPVPFVEQFAKAHPVDADFGKVWNRALPQQAYLFKEALAGHPTPAGHSAFPHVLKGGSDKPDAGFYRRWVDSPFSDAYLGQMAQTAVDALRLGKGSATDFLGVSFSALDYVGHALGPSSHEVQDLLVRLDGVIGTLLAHLDRVVGPDNYVVALTSDHGVPPIPEEMARLGLDAGRISTQEVAERVERALEAPLGAGRHVARVVYTELYFAPGVYNRVVADPGALDAAIHAIRGVPGVWRVFHSEQLQGRPLAEDRVLRAVALSYVPGRSGDLIVVPKPYWFFSEGASTTHGSAHLYDARVPLILMGPGIKRGQFSDAATPADLAPTLAVLAGITLADADGRVLTSALAGKQATREARSRASRQCAVRVALTGDAAARNRGGQRETGIVVAPGAGK